MPRTVAPAADRVRRREFIALAGGAASAAAWMAPARAQALPVIGYLGSESPERYASRLSAFREGLAETGYAEGRNVAIEFRWAEGQYSRLPALAVELANRQVTVIVAPGGAEVALAAKSATTTIPIVFEMGGNPIALGVVSSLSRPGGNLTGVSSLSVEVSRKRLEFMHEVRPDTKKFAVAVNPTSPTSNSQLKNLHAAADALGLELVVLKNSDEQEFGAMFTAVREMQAGGLVFSSDPYFAYRSQQLAALAVRYAVPAMTQSRDFPLAGGLMSYGGDFGQSHRHTGIYAGRVLKGEKPSDLPVQRVTKVELFINLKAAGNLGISFPPSLLGIADRVIE
ncbi:ABC transporter substrate-binding protein [Reyranella sp.]|uniref:ABC transporter substrate-binding protein n=1 Tax=Reyranella sp. TaxID=1929291 RepID=UPI001200945F|nr:ABC transporter substrate-binding protein [Reyranella sp.]TAJ86274.1 MAG: ABC transporter substrate-binding protein [Reyranella sp.]